MKLLMAIINIIAIMLLRKTAIKALKSYEEQKKAGKKLNFFLRNFQNLISKIFMCHRSAEPKTPHLLLSKK